MNKYLSIILIACLVSLGAYIVYERYYAEDSSLVIAPADYDFGNITSGQIMKKDFVITNWRNHSVTLLSNYKKNNSISNYFISPDSSDMLSNITIDPKANTILRVEFDTTNLSLGNISKDVNVEIKGWPSRQVKINISGNIR